MEIHASLSILGALPGISVGILNRGLWFVFFGKPQSLKKIKIDFQSLDVYSGIPVIRILLIRNSQLFESSQLRIF